MTAPYYEDDFVTLYHGDCLEVLATLPDASVDSVVTDPPYGLEFMGKGWDGADGFRRSLNPADAGRESVFGRTSRTSPEYRTTSKATAGMSGTGYTDGAERLERPSFLGGLNPKCLNCGKWQRGGNPCSCDAPDFPNERLPRLHTFQQWCEAWARECLRVLKPGGHLLAFGGSRTWHRLAAAAEDAGFEIRDSIAWLYGSGFPKSLDVSKAIDKRREEDREPRVRVTSWVADECARLGWTRSRLCEAFGVKNQPIQSWTERNPAHAVIPTWENWQRLKALVGFGDEMDAEVSRLNGRKGSHGEAWQNAEVTAIRENAMSNWSMDGGTKFVTREDKAPATPDAERWQGWGTALKPAFEPIVVARKPLAGIVAANVLEYGTGALNIDGCRVGDDVITSSGSHGINDRNHKHGIRPNAYVKDQGPSQHVGRWPANVVLDEHAAAELDRQSGVSSSNVRPPTGRDTRGIPNTSSQMVMRVNDTTERGHADTGGASRFFPTFRYEAKAPSSERPRVDGIAHPTVKPLDLMRWLVRLVTPPGGTVLEPFAGSGTTAEACVLEGFHCIAIEREPDYLPLIVSRLSKPMQLGLDFGSAS